MTDTSKYMNILAKVLRNDNSSGYVSKKEKFNKLCCKIHSDLNSQLKKSMYPFTSDIIQKCENMMDAMEPLYICPEIIGKRCMLISSNITTSVFEFYRQLFDDKELSTSLLRIYTKIPLIIINSDDENDIEILNYVNIRIKLTSKEFEYLLIESGKRKVAINKIIQYVFIKTKLSREDICVISDNYYGSAEKIFRRMVSKKIVNVDSNSINTIGKWHLFDIDALVMSEDVMQETIYYPYTKKCNNITYKELDDFVNNNVKQVLYGFRDEFITIKSQILDYYENQIIESKKILQDVVGDIVRLGDSADYILSSIRKGEEEREKKIQTDKKKFLKILKDIEELVVNIGNDLDENHVTGKQVSRYVLDDIFDSFFRVKNFSSFLGKSLISRLHSIEYNDNDLLSTYTQIVSGKKASYDMIEIKKYEWEKAKMLLYILEPEKIPDYYLRMYVKALGKRCISGKELYAKALISEGKEKKVFLQESFDKGYEKAGFMLIEMYKNGDKEVNLLSLANALVPEACMIVADQRLNNYRDERRFIDLSDNKFTYYKIAATKQYSPAIGKIIDAVFESRFNTGFQIPRNNLDDEVYRKMIDYGHVICKLCQFLISKMYKANHYSEIMGIVLFSINENLSEAMNLLTDAKSPLAYYCKGNMYEFGNGVAVDLNQAIVNYKKASEKGSMEKAKKRLEICIEKRARYEYEQSSTQYYQSTKRYTSSMTKTESKKDDGCFAPGTHVLMADGMLKCVDDIEVGDKVLVFDHYKGVICEDIIIGNIHKSSDEKEYDVITLVFGNDLSLSIVKSHALFDLTENQYVWIDSSNFENYIGHKFAYIKESTIEECELVKATMTNRRTKFYMPLSRYHLNIFAEGILTMPPTKITVNLFNIASNMKYDLSPVDAIGKTSYDEIKNYVSIKEYSALPCEFLACVLDWKQCDFSEFEYAIQLYRDQRKCLL